MSLATQSHPLVVIKIGGSLLTLPDLGARVTALLDQRPDVRSVFVVGGGAAADAVRAWGAIHSLSEETCHDLAMESLNTTAGLLAAILPRSRIVEDRSEAERCWEQHLRPILRLQNLCSASCTLPKSWDVTSDSLAAWLAIHWQADELWLVKSTPLVLGISPEEASRQELVDRYFPRLAAEVAAISWCNLRETPSKLQSWIV